MGTTGNNYFIVYFAPEKEGCYNKLFYFFDKQYQSGDIPLLVRGLLGQSQHFEVKNYRDVEDPDRFHPIIIKVHSALDLLTGQPSNTQQGYNFSQELLKDENLSIKVKIPILHLALSDLINDPLFGNYLLPMDIPRAFMIMDNSIWNYLVPISSTYYVHNLAKFIKEPRDPKNIVQQDYKNNFYEAVVSILKNYKKNLYRLIVAQEYADLNARLTEQSYLSGAHAIGVSPFIFHSEVAAKQLIQREFRLTEKVDSLSYDKRSDYEVDSRLDHICKHKWRILLLDDKAVGPMETEPFVSGLDSNKGGWNCKLEIIRNILESRLNLQEKVAFYGCCDDAAQPVVEKKPDENTIILIEYAQSLDDAYKAIREKKYDLILIDYLLNQTNGTHYGYELLDKIWEDRQQDNENKELSQRLYCMFISAYSYAVHDRLLAEGMNQSGDYWFINVGACPTNTPQLFLYNLLKLMDKRLNDSGILDISIDKILKLAKVIFIPRKMVADKSSVRERASEHYQDVLSLQYYYRKMLKDVEIPQGYKQGDHLFNINGSVLISHFMLENQHLDGLLEHLTELVHLTAFGTIRQWAEMWEEYLYIRAKLDEIDDKRQDFKAVCDYIEEYILNLKAQQR